MLVMTTPVRAVVPGVNPTFHLFLFNGSAYPLEMMNHATGVLEWYTKASLRENYSSLQKQRDVEDMGEGRLRRH